MTQTTCHIHYHSGTGNTRRVAMWIAECAADNGETVRLHPIDKRNPEAPADIHPADRLVIAMPTHSFTTPWPVLKHLAALPRGRGASALLVATRAGFRVGNTFGFGVEGTAWLLGALLLRLKGYRPRGATGIDMPSNWIQAHPGFPKRTAQAITKRAHAKTRDFARRTIINGKRHWLSPMNIFQVILGILLLPVALGYLLVGRFMLGKILYADQQCTHCGACMASCPAQAIAAVGPDRHPWWTYRCTNCMRCLSICPTSAVQTCHGWIALLIALILLPVPAFLARLLGWSLLELWPFGLLYAYAVLFLAYPLLFLLSRSKSACRLLRGLSLTAFWRRYLEPETRPEELASDHPQTRG